MVLPRGVVKGVPNPRWAKFRDRLRRSRLAAGMHAAGLSSAAGLNSTAVLRLESGSSLPQLPTVEKLARALGLSPGWLAFGLGDAAAHAGAELGQSLADRARATRLERGLSAMGLARQAGLTDGAVRSVEGGRHSSLSTIEALAVAMGISPTWLAYGTEPRELPRRGSRAAAANSTPAP